MKIKKLVLVLGCSFLMFKFFGSTQNQPEPGVDFYDVNFLQSTDAVQKALALDGFFEINFTTRDNLLINGTMLDQSNRKKITTTILSCSGFYPGRKEGMTTLYAMLKDEPYNFLFFDARGHGKSQGEMLTFQGLKHYGESEYLDVVAALQFLVLYNKEHGVTSDIVVHGLCSGAFHTIKAVTDLKKSDPEAYECIKGIVIDSGWSSVADIIETSVHADTSKHCQQYYIPWIQPLIAGSIIAFYRTFFKDSHCNQQSIFHDFAKIDQPILFIHALDDTYVPIELIHPLVTTSKKATTWYVKDSSHVTNHLQHKDEYKVQLKKFVESISDKNR